MDTATEALLSDRITGRLAERRATAQTLPLPFDDGIDDAVPFVLTAAAHREVLGRTVRPVPAATGRRPQPGPAGAAALQSDDAAGAGDGSELVRAQSRALLRSGMPIATIAAALGTDVRCVERWTADLGDELARRRRRRGPLRSRSAPAGAASGGPVGGDPLANVDERSRDGLPVTDRHLAGLVYALAHVDVDGVAIVHDRIEPVAELVRAIRERMDVDPSRIRVAVRVGPDVPVDRARTVTAERLGVDPVTVVVGRSAVPGARDLELRVDIRDAGVAEQLRRWRDGESRDGSGLRGWDSNPQTFRLTADCSAS